MNKATLIPIVLLTVLSFSSVANAATKAELRTLAKELVGPLPKSMPGSSKDTQAQIQLGKELYFDTILSENNTISCNSCHVVDNKGGGVDNEATSPGAFGKRGGRNSPTVLNAGFQIAQFWDGRAATLEEQAKGPVLNPIEMAMPDEEIVIKRLNGKRSYRNMFKKAFPGAEDPVTYDNLANAIASFERTLVTHDRFDDFQNGKDKALTKKELKGLETFLTIGCTTCHNSPTMGGNSYQKVGLIQAYENTEDIGRAEVTKNDDDKYKFKVAMLRNVALTGPYFHDGKVKTLEEAILKMGKMQLGLDLTSEQVESLVAFFNALTDKERGGKK